MKVFEFMQKAESKQKISVTGKQRFEYIYGFLKKHGDEIKPLSICDIGGTAATKMFFEKVYPDATVEGYNIDEDELSSPKEGFHYLDIEKEDLPQKYGMVFAGDIIEHLIEPFDAVKRMVSTLNVGGVLIVTTPNIANIYNRIFLSMGFALGNYHPTMRYKLGNPFLDKGDGVYAGSHKSLFNWRGLLEMEELLGMRVIYKNGFSYYDTRPNVMKTKETFKVQYSGVRKAMNAMLLNGLREGMICISRRE